MNKTLVLLCAVIVSVIALMTSCSKDPKHAGLEYMPDMYRSPSYEVYSANPNFKDSMSMRIPPVGTVPRNYQFFEYPNTMDGYIAAGNEVKNPLALNDENLAEGKRLFNIFCVHCHGATGNGDGAIVANGKFPPPPSYSKGNSSRGGLMKDLTDGKIFHTITYGVNLMGPHASLVNPAERWKIVQYVHELQHDGETPAATGTTPADSTTASTQSK